MDDGEVEYDVSGWPQERLERLLGTLARAGITFEVERGNLVVRKVHEPRVDSLITAIEGEAPVYDASAFGSPLPPPPPPPGFGAYPPPPGVPPMGGAWPGYPVVRPKTSGYAIASLVLGLVWICGLGSLLAVIFGGVALSQIKKSEGRTTGTGLAIAGLVLGILGLLLVAASLIWGEDTTSAPLR